MKGGPEYRLPLKIVFLGDTAVTSYRFVVKMNGPGIDMHRRYRTTLVLCPPDLMLYEDVENEETRLVAKVHWNLTRRSQD